MVSAIQDMCSPKGYVKGIKWSLRAARLFLGARAVIKFVSRAASTLENADGEQRALRKFSRQKRFAPSNLADIVSPVPSAYSQLYLVRCQITSGSFA